MSDSNPELEALFADDQADRHGPLPHDLATRDHARRARVEALLAAGAVRTAADHLNAAFVFQHGDRLEHYWQAHELALRAVELGHDSPAAWLAAAAYDRWLMAQGLPQKFGTQYRQVGARFVLYDVDPTTTDEERARWDVPPLAEAQRQAERLTRELVEELRERAAADEPDPPGTLAVTEVPGLRVALVALTTAEVGFHPEAMPVPAPLDPAQPHPVPAYLPAGLEARQFGDAYCAVDASGQFQMTWLELPLPVGMTLHLAWDLAEGPAPAMQGFQLHGHEAIAVSASWSTVSAERLPLVVTRASVDTCWLVGGRLPIEELARIAVSLPVA